MINTKNDAIRVFVVFKIKDQPDVRKVTAFHENLGVLRNRSATEYLNIQSEEGLSGFLNIKEEVLGSGKTPVKIIEEEQLIYYIDPDEKGGIIFSDENDAKELFLNIEETYQTFVKSGSKSK